MHNLIYYRRDPSKLKLRFHLAATSVRSARTAFSLDIGKDLGLYAALKAESGEQQ